LQPLLVDDPPSVGPFRLVARLGAGGMGQVILATDGGRNLVALELVHPALAHDGEFRERFRREVAAVPGADPDAATPWLAPEYVPGPSLDDAVTDPDPDRGRDEQRLDRLPDRRQVGLARPRCPYQQADERDQRDAGRDQAEDGQGAGVGVASGCCGVAVIQSTMRSGRTERSGSGAEG